MNSYIDDIKRLVDLKIRLLCDLRVCGHVVIPIVYRTGRYFLRGAANYHHNAYHAGSPFLVQPRLTWGKGIPNHLSWYGENQDIVRSAPTVPIPFPCSTSNAYNTDCVILLDHSTFSCFRSERFIATLFD